MQNTQVYKFLLNVNAAESNLWSYVAMQGANIMCSKSYGVNVDEDKRRLLEDMAEASRNLFHDCKDKIMGMMDNVGSALVGAGYETRLVRAELTSRGSFGISSEFGLVAFEQGLSFDPYLNIPFIPGSSIKGAVRNAYLDLCHSKRKLSSEDAENACKLIFGGENTAGLVGFTDAYPIEAGENGFILYPDVITPHYKDVKTELDVNPNPIVHLTIAPGTVFQFFVYWRRRGNRELRVGGGVNAEISLDPKPTLAELGLLDLSVLYALKLGLGAKTLVGYSTFKVVEYRPFRRQKLGS